MISCRNGSMMVDAAISIPIFVIALVTVLMLIVQCGHEAETFNEMSKYAEKTVEMVAASGIDSPGLYVKLDNGSSIDNVLIVNRSVKTQIPIDMFRDRVDSSLTLAFRPFLGESKQSGFVDTTRVYIFPKRGECYHTEGCRDMQDGCIQSVLTDKIRRKYRACKICNPDQMKNGSVVYLYSASSRVYHRKSCASITKIYVGTTKSEAAASGYRPCMHCIGKSETGGN